MRIKETQVYQFDELSDRAKERAREWYRRVSAEDFADWSAETVIDDAVRLGDLIGISIATKPVKLMNGSSRPKPVVYWSGFCSQGDGACFEGSYAFKRGGVKALSKEAPTGDTSDFRSNNEVNRIAQELAEVQKRNFYQLQASIRVSGQYSHSGTMTVDVERADSKPLTADAEDTITDCLRSFADWIYHNLEREYGYQRSDEVTDENIRANEYEFNEEGGRE